MEEKTLIGQMIKNKRLELNLSSEELAFKSGISRATLWSLEKGGGNPSLGSLLRVMKVLGISFFENDRGSFAPHRERASRRVSSREKKLNRFIVMCLEQFASFSGNGSQSVFRLFKEAGLLQEMCDDYEDLHGMSVECLNDYFSALLPMNSVASDQSNARKQTTERVLAKTILIAGVIEFLVREDKLTFAQARERLYDSEIAAMIDDDETGLYGQSPLYIYSLYRELSNRSC